MNLGIILKFCEIPEFRRLRRTKGIYGIVENLF